MTERTIDATTPIFMLKRTGRAAELAGLEETEAAPELAAVEAEEGCVLLTVTPKPVEDDGMA